MSDKGSFSSKATTFDKLVYINNYWSFANCQTERFQSLFNLIAFMLVWCFECDWEESSKTKWLSNKYGKIVDKKQRALTSEVDHLVRKVRVMINEWRNCIMTAFSWMMWHVKECFGLFFWFYNSEVFFLSFSIKKKKKKRKEKDAI